MAASEFIGFVCKSSVSFVYTINTDLWLQIKDAVDDVFQHLCNALPYTWVIFTWFLTKSSNIIFKRSKSILCVKALLLSAFMLIVIECTFYDDDDDDDDVDDVDELFCWTVE